MNKYIIRKTALGYDEYYYGGSVHSYDHLWYDGTDFATKMTYDESTRLINLFIISPGIREEFGITWIFEMMLYIDPAQDNDYV